MLSNETLLAYRVLLCLATLPVLRRKVVFATSVCRSTRVFVPKFDMGFPSAVTTFLVLFQGWRSSVHVISIDTSHCDDHRQVKDFNDEFRSLDKARTNSRGWSGLLWYGWGCWWKNFHKSMGSPFRLQSRKNMMNYEEILWVPLNYCRIFLLTSVFSSFGCFTTHLANGTIKQDVWLCQCTRGKCRCQWNPQTRLEICHPCQDGSGVLEPVEYGP